MSDQPFVPQTSELASSPRGEPDNDAAPQPPPGAEPAAPQPPPSAEPLDDLAPPMPPEGEPPAPFAFPPSPPRDPFWSYHDLLIFLGTAPIALLAGALLVKGAFAVLHIKPATTVIELLPEQFLGYLLLYAVLAAVFRVWYARPFWSSLGWRPMRVPFSLIIIAGMATGILVALGAGLIHVKDEANPLTDLMKGRTALILMAIFGVTIAPIAEELAFRGFLQPLLVRSLGAAPGILLTAIPFGLLHYQEYGNSWTHVVLICFAGAAFGAMRQLTGSTKAAALMHASYNALFFIAAFSAGKDFPH